MVDVRESVRESIVQFDSLFGILSEPVTGARDAPVIVLSNAGSAHHVGPNRLYVLLARALSREGFRCLRFDLPGLGDSFVDDRDLENEPYPSDISAILGRAVQAMNAPVVLAGLCAGAHGSFHAALDLDAAAPVVETVLINPLTFYYQRGMPLDQPDTNSEWQRYMKSVRSVERWRKLLRGRARVGGIVRTVFRRFRDIAIRKFRPHVLEQDVRRIAASGRKLTFVFSRFDPGYDLLMINAGRAVKQLCRQGSVALWRIDGANHTFETRRSREVMIASLVRHLASRYPRGST